MQRPGNAAPITAVLLNLAHAIDHMFLLIFATAVGAIALDFGFARWEDLMPYGTGAFLMFGLGSIPAGRLGDLWGRRAMMLVFYFGMGVSALLCALTNDALQLGIALTLLGLFSAIYHPVGIPMLVQKSKRPGATLGVSGLSGNLGIAMAALVTGLLVSWGGWRLAFALPGFVCLIAGLIFWLAVPAETEPPAKRAPRANTTSRAILLRVFLVVTATAVTGSLLFNFTTNGNGQLLGERMAGLVNDPALLGLLLAGIYTIGAFSQIVVGRLIDRIPMKPLFLSIVVFQAPLFWLASGAQGWVFYVLAVLYMVAIFAVIPFTDALIVRYVDDSMRSRIAGMRLAVAFGVSSLAVWMLGPVVKVAGFETLLLAMAGIAAITVVFVALLPADRQSLASAVA